MKRCTKCHSEKPPTEFRRESRTRAGLHAQCRICQQAAIRNSTKKRKVQDPDFRQRLIRRRNEYTRADNDRSRLGAVKHRQAWGVEDLAVLRDPALTASQLAARLGRTRKACEHRREKLQKELGLDSIYPPHKASL